MSSNKVDVTLNTSSIIRTSEHDRIAVIEGSSSTKVETSVIETKIVRATKTERISVVSRQGPAGVSGLSFYSDQGIPEDTFGFDNELYLDLTTSFLYKKISGTWTYQSTIAGATAQANFRTDVFVLTMAQVLSKEVQLPDMPSPPEKTTVEVHSAPTQAYGIDFFVLGNKVKWGGLAFELLLDVGTIITIRYFI